MKQLRREEFGSDFNLMSDYPRGVSLPERLDGRCRMYANGRQALEAILIQEDIRRLWVPSYYCYESLAAIRRHGTEVHIYDCQPLSDPEMGIDRLRLGRGDALMRMNYFGLMRKPSYSRERNYLLIEDHSHCLTGDWASGSDADWCFASLRKIYPIADGGIVWSPRGRELPPTARHTQAAMQNSARRYAAMSMKSDYLDGKRGAGKEVFLQELGRTEEAWDMLPLSAISRVSEEIVSKLDIAKWEDTKLRNRQMLRDAVPESEDVRILDPMGEGCKPFSFVMLLSDKALRDTVRQELIRRDVYPAILWRIPEAGLAESVSFGGRMLSIHCDGRYSPEDIGELACRINHSLGR